MNKVNKNIIYLILVILLGLTPLLWFKGSLITGEEYFALDYGAWGDLYSNTWGSASNYGDESIWVPFRFQGYFFNFLKLLGLSSYLSLITWYVFLWVATSLSFYKLVSTLFKDKIEKPILVIATLFYVLNPYFLNIPIFYTPPRLLFIFLPLLFLALYHYEKSEGPKIKYIFVLSLLLLIASPIYVNIPTASILLIPIIIYILYSNITAKKYFNILKHIGILGAFFLLFNEWWIIPTWWKVGGQLNSIKRVTGGFITIDKSPVNDVISYFGSWAFRENAGGLDYFPFYRYFDQLPLVLLRYIPFIIIFSVILMYARKPDKSILGKYIVFVMIVFWGSLFLAKGVSGLGGQVFAFIFKYFPAFWIYREPYAKFMPLAILTGSILLPIGINYLLSFLPNNRNILLFKNALLGFLVIIGLSLGYPIWTSKIISMNNNMVSRSSVVVFPDYWKRIQNEWKPGKGYYITFPSQAITEIYLWPSGYSGSPFVVLKKAKVINVPAFLQTNIYSDSTIAMLYDHLIRDPDKFVKHAKQYNLSGIIFQGDTAYGKNTEKQAYFKDKYKEFLSVEADKVDIYEFDKNVPEVEIVSKDRIYNSAPLNILGYRVSKKILPDESLINYQETSVNPDIYVLNPDLSKNFEYNLDNINEGEYSLKIVGDVSKISNITIDTKDVSSKETKSGGADALELDMSIKKAICCKTMNVIPEIAAPTIITTGINRVRAADTQLPVYYTELKDYDLENSFNVIVSLGSNLPFDTVVGITQIDNISGMQKVIGTGLIQAGSSNIQFTTTPTGMLDTAFAPTYIITLQPNRDVPKQLAETQINITNISVQKIPYYTVTLVNKNKNINNIDPTTKIDAYDRIENSLIVVNIKNNDDGNSLIQFKESYDARWGLYRINEKQYKSLSSNLVTRIISAFIITINGNSYISQNVEGYSNAWDLDTGTDMYYAIIYKPEYITDFFMIISLVSVVTGSIYFFLIKKHA